MDIGQLVALLTAVVALAKGALDLLKEYQANKATLSNLVRRRRFWVATALVLVGFGALFVVAKVRISPTKTPQVLVTVTVQIWSVVEDHKHQLVHSKGFAGGTDGVVTGQTARDIARWIKNSITPSGDSTTSVTIHLHVPPDLSTDRLSIDAQPPGTVRTYFWVAGGNSKARLPLDEAALATLGRDFRLEIGRPGYETKAILVTWHQEVDTKFTLAPQQISVGIEEFAGRDNALAVEIADSLAIYPRISVKTPDKLAVLRDTIAAEQALIATHPAVQVGLRSNLGLDFLVSGSYR